MKIKLVIVAVMLSVGMKVFAAKYQTGQYQIDPVRSKISFTVPHLGVSRVHGRFRDFFGILHLHPHFSKSIFSASLEVDSITTDTVAQNEQLKSDLFFDAAKFPKVTFTSTTFKGTPERFTMMGELTIKDVTKVTPIVGRYLGTVRDSAGKVRAVFSASASVNRKDFKLSSHDLVDTVSLVGDEVEIDIVLEAFPQ